MDNSLAKVKVVVTKLLIIWLIITADGMVVTVEVMALMEDPSILEVHEVHKFFRELKHGYTLQSAYTCCVVHLFSPTAEVR